MPQQTRTNFKNGVSSVIYTNTQKLVKGNTVRDKFLVMADSVLFFEDANVPGRFLGIDATNQNVDISFIKSTSPSGKFLKDDGTWATAGGALPSQTGNAGTLLTTNGTSASWSSQLPSLTLNSSSGNYLTIVDGANTPQLFIDSSKQFAFNAGGSGPIYFGAFNNPSAGLAGFSIPNNVIMGISANNLCAGFGGGGAHFAIYDPEALVDVHGKADEVQLLVSGVADQSSDIVQVMNFNRTANYITIDSGGKLTVTTSANITALKITAGSTTVAPLSFVSGSLLTTPVAGSFEFLTDRLYFTKTTGSTRETLAYLSDIPSGNAPGGSDNHIQFKHGAGFEGSANFIWENNNNYFKVKGRSYFGTETSVNPTALVDIAAADTSRASLRIRPIAAGGDGPTDPNNGDIWMDGTDIYIQIDNTTRRFQLI